MKFLDKIYTITIYNEGRLCWEVSSRDKALEDYKRGDRVLALLCAITLPVIAFVHWL